MKTTRPILKSPTVRQLEVLTFIRDYIAQNPCAPSIRDIRDHFRFGGTNGVNDHLRALERRGLIERDEIKSRALALTDAGHALLEGRAPPPPEPPAAEMLKRIEVLEAQVRSLQFALPRGIPVPTPPQRDAGT